MLLLTYYAAKAYGATGFCVGCRYLSYFFADSFSVDVLMYDVLCRGAIIIPAFNRALKSGNFHRQLLPSAATPGIDGSLLYQAGDE